MIGYTRFWPQNDDIYPFLAFALFVTTQTVAAALPQSQVDTTTRAMALYESFRPEVSEGKSGWGQSGMLRLGRVTELRDGLVKETARGC